MNLNVCIYFFCTVPVPYISIAKMLLQSPYLEEGIMSACRLNLFDLKCSLLGDDRRITPMQAVKNESLCLQQKKMIFFKELRGLRFLSAYRKQTANLQVDSLSFCKLRLTRIVDVRTQRGACGKEKQEALVGLIHF